MVTTDNLVRYFSCDDNAASTTVTDSTSTQDGTASTNTSNLSASGKIETAFDVDGSTEFFDSNYQWGGTGVSITFAFWCNPDVVEGVFMMGAEDAAGERIRIEFSGDKLSFIIDQIGGGNLDRG